MKQLNDESTNTINQMVGMMSGWGIKIDNSNGEFMPLFISTTYDDDSSKIFTVGHYHSEGGDILADPEMQFLLDLVTGSYFPLYYRLDALEIENYSVKIDNGLILSVNKSLQGKHTEFANQWLRNIRQQQNLKHLTLKTLPYGINQVHQ